MKLVLFNGSPRNKKSNSKILCEHFLAGYNRMCQDIVPVHYLANFKKREEQKEAFRDAETVIFIFPLYTDCMPGIVKEFFESIAEIKFMHPKKIGFIVQSGFPEAIHSVCLERYLNKFTERLQCEYLGTVIKGGVEGIQVMPPWMTKKLYKRFENLGEYFAKNEAFSQEISNTLREPYQLSEMRKVLFTVLIKTGLANLYWNSHLKKYGAFKNRFDQPFVGKEHLVTQ